MNMIMYTKEFCGATIGELYTCINGAINSKYYTLECPWEENANYRSCIPGGNYYCKKTESGIHVIDVPHRWGIKIHAGNTVEETEGCIIIGTKLLTNDYGVKLIDSKPAYEEIESMLDAEPDKEGRLIITRK